MKNLDLKNILKNIKNAFGVKDLRATYILLAVFGLISFIMWYSPLYIIDYYKKKEEISVFYVTGDNVFLFLEIAALIISLASLLLPVIMKKPKKPLHLLGIKIYEFYNISMFLIMTYAVIDTISKNSRYVNVEYYITFMGIIYIALQITTVIYSFITSSKLKKIKKSNKNFTPSNIPNSEQ